MPDGQRISTEPTASRDLWTTSLKPNVLVRIVAPVLAISALPLIVVVASAWQMHSLQRKASRALDRDVAGVKSGEQLSISILEIRHELNEFVDNPDRVHLTKALEFRHAMDSYFKEAQGAAEKDEEKTAVTRLGEGYGRFFEELRTIDKETLPPNEKARKIRRLVDVNLEEQMLKPARDYLNLNEDDIVRSNSKNRELAQQAVLSLLLLGICGPLSGLVAGFGIARGYSRSIVRLSLPIQDAAGKLNEIVGPIIFSSQAGLDEIEIVLHKIVDQIGAVVKRLDESQREALRAEQLASVGQMAAGIAHELRNPLMAMKILVQAAADNSPPFLGGRDLMVLEEEITRLERSTETFLDFARPPEPERRTFDLRALVGQVLDLVSARAERQGVSLRCDVPEDRVVPVQADMGQVRQVLLNLLLNALDAVPGGGAVWIEMKSPGSGGADADGKGWLTLRVCDTGAGLPGELGAKIFEPFVGSKPSGLGLGLSICKRIIESHGGSIQAANRPEGGAVFTIELPTMASPSPMPQLVGNRT
jgi:two-component system, NtrC family, sensor histidine kinase HydH